MDTKDSRIVLSQEEQKIILALRDPEKLSALMTIKDEEQEFSRKYSCCTAAMFGQSLAESVAHCSREYKSALRSLLNLPDEAWESREYAWANSGHGTPCQTPRPCKRCILDMEKPAHIHGSPKGHTDRVSPQE